MEGSSMSLIEVKQVGYELRVDSRIIAKALGVDHKSTLQLIDRHQSSLKRFGTFTFKMWKSGGRPTRYFLLNRSQAELLLTLTRNTPESVELKVQLIIAFDEARSSLEASNTYLPFYHQAHDSLQTLVDSSGSSTPPAIHHMNFEKLINRHFGLSAGTRNEQPPEIKLMISAAMALSERIYKQALANGQNHKQGYQSVKEALEQHLFLAPVQLKGAAQ
jgi:phage regulator Rha-like protein